jgi:site-specific DNA recombinase
MSPIHTRNHGMRYRYYASHEGDGSKEPALRLPASGFDHAIRTALQSFLADAHRISKLDVHPVCHADLISSFGALAPRVDGTAIAELRKLLQQAQLRVSVSREAVRAKFDLASLAEWVGVDLGESQNIVLSIAASQTTWGHEPRLRLDPPIGTPANDPKLVQLLARGFAARDQLLAMTQEEVRAMPDTQPRHLERVARLAYLAPGITLAWSDQHKILGFEHS